MQKNHQNLSNLTISYKSDLSANGQNDFDLSFLGMTGSDSFQSCQYSGKKENNSISKFGGKQNHLDMSNEDSFYSQSEQIKVDDNMDDELILNKTVQKRDIFFSTRHFKQSFIKYFIDVIYGFLKQPNDLSFAIALNRLKYYNEQTPFLQQTSLDSPYDHLNTSTETQKSKYQGSNCKTTESQESVKIDYSQSIKIEQLLKSMFYQCQYSFMIYTFDYSICHLTFIAAMLYFWSKIDHPVAKKSSGFRRISLGGLKSAYRQQNERQLIQQKNKKSIYKTLKLYVKQRSQSLNISQPNILIVHYFLNYLKNSCFTQFTSFTQIQQIQQNLIRNLQLYRRIKRLQKQFNSTENKIIFQSQLHKYQNQNKLIQSMEKTFNTFHLINMHHFVSTPLQRYFQLYQFHGARKYYHLKKDCFSIWILNIILNVCQKKNAQSISKSSYYVITFLAILKKYKQHNNFEGISLILPILYNIKQQLPKVWSWAQSRRPQISILLQQYSKILSQKCYLRQQIAVGTIISQQVIFEMCQRFTKYTQVRQSDHMINTIKHQKFCKEFLGHVLFHRAQVMGMYQQQIKQYQKDKEIGISFNMYLLDTYVWKAFRGISNKIMWDKLLYRSKFVNSQITYNLYIDIIDYCFVGSTIKYKQLDI